MKLSDWQDGVPKEEGIYQIYVPEHDDDDVFNGIYHARFKNGKWDAGSNLDGKKNRLIHSPYPINNDPKNPRKWRGLIDD